jgi:cytochrome c553
MNIKLAPLFAMTGLALFAGAASADSLVAGSAGTGEAKALTCTACHGAEGVSANPVWPNIAGQNAPYMLHQLQSFKNGGRVDPLMSSQAMLLSDEDMNDLAVYFESLPAAAQAVADAGLVDLGEALYRGGNADTGTPACLACHGPSGKGNPAARYPAVAGQHATYTTKQLNDYASGTRQTDGKTRVMRDIAARLSKEEIAALSSYMQGLK